MDFLSDRWIEAHDGTPRSMRAKVRHAADWCEFYDTGSERFAEMFFFARNEEGKTGFLIECEFDDDFTPSAEYIERARDAAHANGALFRYYAPGNAEIFAGRAAFWAFFPTSARPPVDAMRLFYRDSGFSA